MAQETPIVSQIRAITYLMDPDSQSGGLVIPSLAKEGWLRHYSNVAKPPLPAQTGWFVQATE